MRPVKPEMSLIKISTLLLVIVITAVIFTAGCTQTQQITIPKTTVPTVVATPLPATKVMTIATPVQNGTGMANPASVYCGQVGGTTEIKKDAQGNEYGMCNFPNGTSYDEWALYRGEISPNITTKNTTVAATGTNKTANLTAVGSVVNTTVNTRNSTASK
jgi:putative hemolysin